MSFTDVREGRLVISVPEDQYFRLEDCPTFEHVKQNSLTEADFGWMVQEGETLWLMELKDYGVDRPHFGEKKEKLHSGLAKNIAHAFLMIASVWSGTPFGNRLRKDIERTFPTFPKAAVPVQAAAIIHTDIPNKAALGSINTSVNGALSELGLSAVVVLEASSPRLKDRLGIRLRYDPV